MLDIYMTVKDLKEALANAPDDALVCYQRIEDFYFEKHGWKGDMLVWQDGQKMEYLRVFSAYTVKDKTHFVLNAHY